MKTNNKLIIYLSITVLVLIVFAIIGKKQGWIGQGNIIKVSIDTTSYKTIIETVSANGKIQPEVEVKISPEVSGEIIDIYIEEGDSTITGQLLLIIDPKNYEAALERSTAALNTAKANLATSKAGLAQVMAQFIKTEASFNRNKKLFDESVISESQFEEYNASYLASKAEVESSEQNIVASEYNVKSAEASVKESEENLERTKIFSPIDGIVSKLNVEKGERVVQTSMMAGTELMRVSNLLNMEVSVNVNENDIVRVSLNDTAIIEVDAYLNQKFKGVVTSIANSANIIGVSAEEVSNFIVKIRILRLSYEEITRDNKNIFPFRPGMSATVEIQTDIKENVLAVPIGAVTMWDESKEKGMEKLSSEDKKKNTTLKDSLVEMVFVYKNEKAIVRNVKTGIQDDASIQILSGLNENEEVISAPYSAISRRLKNDDTVNKVDKTELFKKED